MSLQFEKAPALRNVEQKLAKALWHLGEPLETGKDAIGRALQLTKPVQVYTLSARAQAGAAAPRWRASGLWRSVVLDGGKPVATLQFQGRGAVAVRGRDSAGALLAALEAAEHHAGKRTYKPRFVVLPRLYITAVWLSGPNPVFIPTRDGSAERPEPTVYKKVEFEKLIRRHYKKRARSLPAKPQASVRRRTKAK
ncbi:MAG TPA: hypothetical protein VGG48_10360 [Rhizomicrobium sp.]|jgi:hypothetical protein